MAKSTHVSFCGNPRPLHLRPQAGDFGFVVRPGLDDQGSTKVKAKIVLKKDGQRMGKAVRLDLPTVKVIRPQVPLESLRKFRCQK